MFNLLLLLSTLISIAHCACFDEGDNEIGGSCYKFVAQKLPFEEARNWCHYQNPVTSSYLAYVPNQITVNFLATIARSKFDTSIGNFWIGLSRRNTSSPWTWDNGMPFVFSNFRNFKDNYAVESIANGIWDTQNEQEKNWFVCSYDPSAPPTFPPATASPSVSTVSTTSSPGASCSRNSTSTILFAYSNDVETRIVADNLKRLVHYNSPPGNGFYQNFANVRFDVKQPESIQYHNDIYSFNASVSARMPDSSLGFSDNTTGSDIFNMIQRFVDNKQALCGSMLLILVQRYPNEVEISDLLEQLRRNHVFVYIIAYDTPSAGNNPHALFDVSDKTNGFCIFAGGDDFRMTSYWTEAVTYRPFQFIAQDFVVSGSGRKELPLFKTPNPDNGIERMFVAITVQNQKLDYHYRSFNYTIADVNGNIADTGSSIYSQIGTGILDVPYLNGQTAYKMTFDYSYTTNDPQRITVRMYSFSYYPFLPFSN